MDRVAQLLAFGASVPPQQFMETIFPRGGKGTPEERERAYWGDVHAVGNLLASTDPDISRWPISQNVEDRRGQPPRGFIDTLRYAMTPEGAKENRDVIAYDETVKR